MQVGLLGQDTYYRLERLLPFETELDVELGARFGPETTPNSELEGLISKFVSGGSFLFSGTKVKFLK